MVFFIRLKIGFFETKFCTMSVNNKTVRLFSEDLFNEKETIIRDSEIISIAISNRNKKPTEIEIHSSDKIYIGQYIDTKSKDEISNAFVTEFGSKVHFE
ncbi:MAG: hypothetical protein Q8S24_03490 [Eubacteriales bacterium]|nr:hypothetical protein [Eubacteriales bacterium]